MVWLVVLLAVLFGFARGIVEGMRMIQSSDVMCLYGHEGVRRHRWFAYYHRLSVLVFAFFALGYGMFVRMPFDFELTALCIFILWETAELGYSVARYGKLIPEYENLIIWRAWDDWVRRLHTLRVLMILTLLYLR